MSAPRIPPLLEPFLGLPPEAGLVVLTGVLGASTNWLLLRWAWALLHEADAAVVLVSFLRDGAFWADGAARLGLDLAGLGAARRFVFVDGLAGLFAAPARAPAAPVLGAGTPAALAAGVSAALDALDPARRAVLLVDQPDALLAAADGVSALALEAALLGLRERVHAAVVTLAADDPLLQRQATPLERHHAALVLSLAHAARCVMALRRLDTGAARDVSGVLRITPRADDDYDAGAPDDADVEYLYHVAGDGSVRVFERGT